VLENTLDARLEVVFKQQLPEVRFHIRTFSVETVNCRKIQDLDFFFFCWRSLVLTISFRFLVTATIGNLSKWRVARTWSFNPEMPLATGQLWQIKESWLLCYRHYKVVSHSPSGLLNWCGNVGWFFLLCFRFGSGCFLLEVWWVLKHHYSYLLHLCHPAPPNCLLSVFVVKKMVDGYITVGHKSPSCVIHVLLNVSQPCNSSVRVNSSHCVLIMCKPFL